MAKHEQSIIVRADARRLIGSRPAGLAEKHLSADLIDDFEIVGSASEPCTKISEEVMCPTQEIRYIVFGRIALVIARLI